MRVSFLLLGLSVPLLSACLPTEPVGMPIGADGQDQVCAARLADDNDLPLSAIRVNARDTAPSGNSMVFVQVAGGGASAACEIDDYGTIVAFNDL